MLYVGIDYHKRYALGKCHRRERNDPGSQSTFQRLEYGGGLFSVPERAMQSGNGPENGRIFRGVQGSKNGPERAVKSGRAAPHESPPSLERRHRE